MSQKEYEMVQEAIRRYQADPSRYNTEQIEQIMLAAGRLGIPFEPEFSATRALKGAAVNLLDSLILGIPDRDAIKRKWGATPLTAGERMIGVAGDAAGFAVPFAGAGKLAGKAVTGLQRMGAGERVGGEVAERGMNWLADRAAGLAGKAGENFVGKQLGKTEDFLRSGMEAAGSGFAAPQAVQQAARYVTGSDKRAQMVANAVRTGVATGYIQEGDLGDKIGAALGGMSLSTMGMLAASQGNKWVKAAAAVAMPALMEGGYDVTDPEGLENYLYSLGAVYLLGRGMGAKATAPKPITDPRRLLNPSSGRPDFQGGLGWAPPMGPSGPGQFMMGGFGSPPIRPPGSVFNPPLSVGGPGPIPGSLGLGY